MAAEQTHPGGLLALARPFIGSKHEIAYFWSACLALCCGAASQYLQIVLGELVDAVNSGTDKFSAQQFTLLLVACGVGLARLMFSACSMSLCTYAASAMSKEIRLAYVSALYFRPAASIALASVDDVVEVDHGSKGSGKQAVDAAGMLAADMLLVDEALGPTWSRSFTGLGASLAGIILMLWTHWPLGLVACGATAISVLPSAKLQPHAARAAAAISPAASAAFSRATEAFSMIKTIFAFRGEALASRRYAERAEVVRKANVRAAVMAAFAGAFDHLGYAFVYAVLFYTGAVFLAFGRSSSVPAGFPSTITGGQVLAIIAISFETVQAIQTLMETSVRSYIVAWVAARRLQRVISARDQTSGPDSTGHTSGPPLSSPQTTAYSEESTEAVPERPSSEEVHSARDHQQCRTIAFEDVHFAYPSAPDKPILAGVSFVIPPGAYAALTGPSGCGKSTIVQLLLGFYRPQKGRITLDGVDISTIPLSTLRSSIGYVPQAVAILPCVETVHQQIALGALTDEMERSFAVDAAPAYPPAPMQRGFVRALTAVDVAMGGKLDANVRRAAQEAAADSFISKLPGGYNAKVTGAEGGSTEQTVQLSGGQRQRLGIARALMRSPWLCVADEPTSALDGESEEVVQAALEGLVTAKRPHLTLLVVTHKFQCLKNATHIIVFDKGKVVQTGTHESLLMEQEGMYAALLSQQLLRNIAMERLKRRAWLKIQAVVRVLKNRSNSKLRRASAQLSPTLRPTSPASTASQKMNAAPTLQGHGRSMSRQWTMKVGKQGSIRPGAPHLSMLVAHQSVFSLSHGNPALQSRRVIHREPAAVQVAAEDMELSLPSVPYSELLSRVSHYKIPCLFLIAFALMGGAVWPIAGLYVARATGAMYEDSTEAMMRELANDISYLSACMVAQSVTEACSMALQGLVAAGLTARLRNEAVAHILAQGPAWFDAPNRSPASVAARIASFSDMLGKSLAPAVAYLLYTAIYAGTALGLALHTSPLIFGTSCAVGVLYMLPPLLNWCLAAPLRATSTDAMGLLASTCSSVLSPAVMHNAQALGIERVVVGYVAEELAQPLKLERAAVLAEAVSENVMATAEILSWCLCMWSAGQLMLLGLIEPGDALAGVYMSMFFMDALKSIAQRARELATVDMSARSLFQWLPQRRLHGVLDRVQDWKGENRHTVQQSAAAPKLPFIRPVLAQLPATASPTTVAAATPPLIRFERVTFAYPQAPHNNILRGLNLTIHAGQVVCLCGPSGSGKSTVFSLLQGIYAPSSGRILFNGQDVSTADSALHRGRFNWVPQDAPLFEDTLLFNTAYAELATQQREFKPGDAAHFHRQSSMAHLLETVKGGFKRRTSAVRKIHPLATLPSYARSLDAPAGAKLDTSASMRIVAQHTHDGYDESLPNIQLRSMRMGPLRARASACLAAAAAGGLISGPRGLNRDVGPHGSALSGGERQRVAIARALLRDAPVMLLDEDSSALDSKSEAEVQASLDAVRRETPPALRPAMVFIAHRLGRAKKADMIYVLAEGCVLESGTWASLLSRDSLFRKMAISQDHSLESVPIKGDRSAKTS